METTVGKRGRTIRDAYFLKPNRTGAQIPAVNYDTVLDVLTVDLAGSSYTSAV